MAAKKKTKKALNNSKGKRYSAAEKAKVLKHVEAVNGERGRGGITSAAHLFGVTPLTISAWMKSAGITVTRRVSTVTRGDFERLGDLHERVLALREELAEVEAEYRKLKSAL